MAWWSITIDFFNKYQSSDGPHVWAEDRGEGLAVERSAMKTLFSSDSLLVHYDPGSAMFLSCDASAYGLGAVLEQETDQKYWNLFFSSWKDYCYIYEKRRIDSSVGSL